jgi:hypothetical protein
MIRRGLDLPDCRTPGGSRVRRLAAGLRALLPGRGGATAIGLDAGPEDDDGLAGAGVPRRPRAPLPAGTAALELPDF